MNVLSQPSNQPLNSKIINSRNLTSLSRPPFLHKHQHGPQYLPYVNSNCNRNCIDIYAARNVSRCCSNVFTTMQTSMGTFELCVDREKGPFWGHKKGKNLLKLCPKAKQRKEKILWLQSVPVETGKSVGLFCMRILGVRSSSRVFAFICSPSNAMTGLSIPKRCVANYWPGMQTATF